MAFTNRSRQHPEESTGGIMKQQNAMVGTRLPKSLVKELKRIEEAEHTDRSTTVRKLLQNAIQQWNLNYCAQQYAQGRLSMAASAEQAGLTLWEFQNYLRQQKIAAQYDHEDLRHDLKTIAS
jgi:predicted HTH domain antitoxin